MSFLWTIKPVQGLWVGEVTFDRPGEWEALIEVEGGGYDAKARTTFEVKKDGITPEIGQKPPAVETPTIADVDHLSRITMDSNAERRFYELSLGAALEAGRPAVIVFATPKFCTSQVCGPTLSIVKDVAEDFPRVNFVHVEPYELDEIPEKLDPVRQRQPGACPRSRGYSSPTHRDAWPRSTKEASQHRSSKHCFGDSRRMAT
jgi:hypothetical protein